MRETAATASAQEQLAVHQATAFWVVHCGRLFSFCLSVVF